MGLLLYDSTTNYKIPHTQSAGELYGLRRKIRSGQFGVYASNFTVYKCDSIIRVMTIACYDHGLST